jgi:hypothetical protein
MAFEEGVYRFLASMETVEQSDLQFRTDELSTTGRKAACCLHGLLITRPDRGGSCSSPSAVKVLQIILSKLRNIERV